jgi:hypothetical protein
MTHDLPPPIAAYIAANARLNLDAMLAPFSADAIVLDDGGRHDGREALRAWIQSATLDNNAIFVPQSWREEDGQVVVEGLTSGDFKGSPIRFTFRFTLDGDAISTLEIH